MKKILGVIVLAFLVFLGFKGYDYYHDTYVGETYYALVPEETPEKTPTVNDSGEVIEGLSSYIYELTFVNKKGQVTKRAVEISGENPQPLTPKAFVTAEISKKRIVKGPNYITKEEIPEEALKEINL